MIDESKYSEDIRVVILMATYNGEKFIGEQIESIINQSHTNWELVIRDDNSSDSTISIIENFKECDSRITIVKDNHGNGGQCANFDLLMKYALGNQTNHNKTYYMFADQDDYWKKQKIEISLEKIIDIEGEFDKVTPILVYSNYEESNQILKDSVPVYNKQMEYNKKELASRLLTQNWVMGCTTIINKELLKLSVDIPAVADNHDNWMAVLASLVGVVGYVQEPTMIHRIHSSNVTTSVNTTKFSARLGRVINRFKNNNNIILKRYILGSEVSKRVDDCLDLEMRTLLENYLHILESRNILSVNKALTNKFFSVNKLQTILFYLQLMLPREIKLTNKEID